MALNAPGALKAQAELIDLEGAMRNTPGFAGISVLMQGVVASPTTASLGLVGEILVDAIKKLIEFAIQQ